MSASTAEEMALNFDGWLGSQDAETRTGIEQHLSVVPEAGRSLEKQRLASMYAVSEGTGLDLATVNDKWPLIRGGYAEQQGGDWLAVKDDDAAFFGKITQRASDGRNERFLLQGLDDAKDPKAARTAWGESLTNRAQEAAYNGQSYVDALSAWEENNRARPGYDLARAGEYADFAAKRHQEMTQSLEKVRPIAAEAYSQIATARGEHDLIDPGDAAPFALFRGLTPEEKSLAFRVMNDMGGASKDKGELQAFSEAAGRGFENMILGGEAGATRGSLLGTRFNEGDVVTKSDAPSEVRARTIEAKKRASDGTPFGVLAGFAADAMGATAGHKLTAEEAAAWNQQLDTAREDLDTAEQLRSFGQEVVDSTKVGGAFFRKWVLPVADSAALITAFSIPGATGPAMEVSSRNYQNDEYQRLRGLGMDAQQANDLARVTGIAQAALDKVEVEALGGFGKKFLPSTTRTLEQFALRGSRMARFGANFGSTLGVETITELTQDQIVPALVQDVMTNDPRFDVHWGDVWREVAKAAPDTTMGMVLLSAAGGLAQTREQGNFVKEFSGDAAAMRLRGYSLEHIQKIQAAPLEQRGDLLAAFLPAKAPEGADRAALVKDVVTLAAKEAASFEEKQRSESAAASDAADYAVRVVRNGDGWQVIHGDGKTASVNSAEAARRIREDLRQVGSEQEAAALVALVDDWHAKAGDGTTRETTLTGQRVTAGEGGVMRDGKIATDFSAKDLEELDREARMDAQTTGLPAEYSVDGTNRVSLGEKTASGAREIVQRLEINQSPSAVLTFLHESIEADLRAGLHSGSITLEESQRAVASIASAFDPALARDAEEKAFRERVQRVATGALNETELRETLTELAVADTLGRRKDGGKFPAGAVTTALNEAALNATDAQAVREIGKVRAFLRAARRYFRALFGTLSAIKKARREGGAAQFDALIDKITGHTEQAAHEKAVEQQAIALAASGGLDYKAPTAEEEAAGIAFRVTAGDRLELIQKRVDAALAKEPEKRRDIQRRAQNKLQKLQFEWETERFTPKGDLIAPISERRTVKELDKEQGVRQALKREELEAEVYAKYGDLLDDPSLTQIWSGPVMSHLSKPGDKLHGRLMSKGEALRASDSPEGYDGIDGVPQYVFGGSLRADEAAQELYEAHLISEPTADAMWSAIRHEVASVQRFKQFLQDAKGQLKAARDTAREAGYEWRRQEEEKQREDWNPRARLARDLRTLDAILSVLPAELRGKVGGFVKLAQLGSDKARVEEINRRITKMSLLLEKHLQAESTAALEKLIEKAAPAGGPGERPGGKITVEGHRIFSEVERVWQMTEDEAAGERAKLDKAIETEAQKSKPGEVNHALIDLLERQQLFDTFAHFEGKTAAEMDKAVQWLTDVYTTGRNAWRAIEEQRAAEVASLQAQVIEAMGGTSLAARQSQKAVEGSVSKMLENGSLDLLSFVQVLESLLGPKHPLVERWNQAAREATAQKTDAVLAANGRFESALKNAFGRADRLKRRQALWSMATEQRVEINKLEGVARETITAPRDKVEQFRDGTADPVAFGITKDEADQLVAQLADPAQARKKILTTERKTEGKPVPARLTEMEAIGLTLLARQEQYAVNLDAHGYSKLALADAEKGITPQGKALRDFFATEYRDGYEPLARLFRDMFGIDLPQITNYSPASFYHAGKERETDPFGGGLLPEGGFRAGFLKERKAHLAEPRLENAFATWRGHVAMMEHWRAFAPLVRELRGVLGNTAVKASIEGKHGSEMAGALGRWMEGLENNGLHERTLGRVLDGFTREIQRRQATLTLAWKAGSVLKQTLAVFNSAARIPMGAWLRGFSRVISGKVDVKEMWASPMIQRRVESGFSPEVRAAMTSLFNGKPSGWKDFVSRGLETLGEVDAFFTSIGTAIVYDHHLSEGLKAGLSEQVARAQALTEAEDNIGRTAQPSEMMDRSLYELGMSPLEKMGFMFASEQRKSTALVISAVQQWKAGKIDKGQALRVLTVAWLANGLGSALIGAAWRDSQDDDDDAWLDWEHWNPINLAKDTLLGPLGGIPLLNLLASTLMGFTSSGPFQPVAKAWKAGASLFDGDKSEPIEKSVNRVVDLVNGAAMLVPKIEGLAVVSNIAKQVFNLVDNFTPDSAEEKAKKQRAAERKAKQK